MSITRVSWRERQRVAAADLVAEQEYRVRALGRHLLAPHGWGVIRGLWLMRTSDRSYTKWHVSEGLGIDGFGRELLVTKPIDVTIPPTGAHGVFLYYCEAGVTRPACADCRDSPLPRIGQYVTVLPMPDLDPLSSEGVTLELARVAGRPDAVWPVLLGLVSANGKPVNYRSTRYHRQRAGQLRAPGDRARLEQGLLGPEDAYRLLLSTRSGMPRPVKRLAIDRDGQIHVWQPLVISGPEGSVVIPVSNKAALVIDVNMPSGIGRHVLVKGKLENPSNPELVLHWADSLGSRLEERVTLRAGSAGHLDDEVRFGGEHFVAVRLLSVGRRQTRTSIFDRPKLDPDRQVIVREFSAEVPRSKGRLVLAKMDTQTTPARPDPCDPVSASSKENTAPAEPSPLLTLVPASKYVPGPATRELYAQQMPSPQEETSECRLVGGAFDEGDRTSRLAFGVREPTVGPPAGLSWHPLLSIDGGGRVAMPDPKVRLDVEHTLQLPPITNDPTDPLTQDLLALAYNAGLHRVGKVSQTVKIKVTKSGDPAAVPGEVTIEQSLDYGIAITGLSSSVVLKRMIEIIVGQGDNKDVSLRSLPVDKLSVSLPWFQHRSRKVLLAVEALVSDNGKDLAVSSTPVEIVVKPAPTP